jgi:hypothetical protein
LKNLGALSEYAKSCQSSPKLKKYVLILILYLGNNDLVKKTISRYCPFKQRFVIIWKADPCRPCVIFDIDGWYCTLYYITSVENAAAQLLSEYKV